MKKLVLASTIGLLTFTSTQVSAFESELSFGGGYLEVSDSSAEADTDFLSLSGTFYTAPVKTSEGPLAEAGFLSKISSVSLAYVGGDSSDLDLDTTSWSADWRWVTSENNFIFNLQYNYSEADSNGIDSDSDQLSVGLGLYLNDTSTLMFRASSTEADDTDVSDDMGIEYQTLLGAERNIRINAGVLRTELDNSLGGDDGVGAAIGITYYPMKTLGFGISYAKDVLSVDGIVSGGIAVNEIDSDIFGLKADWFAQENFQITFEYLNGEIETIDLEGLAVEATFRF